MTKEKQNFTIWTNVKVGKTPEDKSDEHTLLTGLFTKVMNEIKKGNKVKGLVLKQGQVGFLFGEEPEEKSDEVPNKDSVPTINYSDLNSKSRVGKILNFPDLDKNFVIQEIPILPNAWRLLNKISEKTGKSIDNVAMLVGMMGSVNMKSYLQGDEDKGLGRLAKLSTEGLVKNMLGVEKGSGVFFDVKDMSEILNLLGKVGSKGLNKIPKVVQVGDIPSEEEKNLPQEVQDLLKMMRSIGGKGTLEGTVQMLSPDQDQNESDESILKRLKKFLGGNN